MMFHKLFHLSASSTIAVHFSLLRVLRVDRNASCAFILLCQWRTYWPVQ